MQSGVDLFLKGVAHDLDNVFETINESAHLLGSDPKWSAVAAILRRSAQRGRRIVQSLCESSTTTTDLESVIDEAIEFAGDALRVWHIEEIRFHRDIEPGLRLRGSPMDWQRVLLNLFVNAGQAMKEGGTVEVAARRNGDRVEITVSDHGPGIPAEDLSKVFLETFSTKRSGAGLGLPIVDALVRQNGGCVSVGNLNKGRGATFCITVPA